MRQAFGTLAPLTPAVKEHSLGRSTQPNRVQASGSSFAKAHPPGSKHRRVVTQHAMTATIFRVQNAVAMLGKSQQVSA